MFANTHDTHSQVHVDTAPQYIGMQFNAPSELVNPISKFNQIFEWLLEAGQDASQNIKKHINLQFKAPNDWIILDGQLLPASSLIHELETKKKNLAESDFSLYADSLQSKLLKEI